MKQFLILFSLFITLSAFAQDDKPRYYYDENELLISESIYKKKAKQGNYLKLDFKNDTCNVSLLVRRKNYGKLRSPQFDSLQKSLTDTTNAPKEKFTIIQYYPGADRCNNGRVHVYGDKHLITTKGDLKRINKDVGIKSCWVHKKDDRLDFTKEKRIDWVLDNNATVEKLFFKLHYPCSSFVIIDNISKNYISFFGEYHSLQIVNFLKELHRTD